MAMTEEERREARNAASKRWYAAHKAQNKNKTKTHTVKPMKKVTTTKSVKNLNSNDGPNKNILKATDKLIKKYVKPVNQVKSMMKDVVSILSDAYKTNDEKLIANILKTLGKALSIQVDAQVLDPEGKAKKCVKFDIGTKLFRIPKCKPIVENTESDNTETVEQPVEVDNPNTNPSEILVDTSTIEDIENGNISEEDIINSDDNYTDEDEEYEDEDEDDIDEDDIDEDSLTDEQREKLEMRRAEREAENYEEDYLSGREDMMREMGEMGFGEEN